jgi:hypothetical protein
MHDQLKGHQSPHFHIWLGTPSAFCDAIWRLGRDLGDKFIVRVLQGARMRTVGELFHEFAAALQFPYYFGGNWAALDECLMDLEWLPSAGYVLAIAEENEVLSEEPGDLPTFFGILAEAGRFWGSDANSQFVEAREREPTPFHVILHTEKRNQLMLERKLSTLGHEADEI